MIDGSFEGIVVATVIVVNNEGKYLIAKRRDEDENFGGKWAAPGGKMRVSDYLSREKDTPEHWHNVLEDVAEREIGEEVGLKIGVPGYLTNSVYIRSDGSPCLVVSMFAAAKSEKVRLCDALTDSTWVSSEKAKGYDLIPGLHREFRLLDKRLKHGDIAVREILGALRGN